MIYILHTFVLCRVLYPNMHKNGNPKKKTTYLFLAAFTGFWQWHLGDMLKGGAGDVVVCVWEQVCGVRPATRVIKLYITCTN